MAKPNLLGRVREFLGKAVDKAALGREQAAPTTSFVRNPYAAHAAPGLTPTKLAQILRSSIDGFPERYLALAEDMEERFGHYGSVLATRKRAVAGLEVTVEAAGDEQADKDEAELVREVVESAAFRLSKIDMLDAIGKGFSATEMIWETGSIWKPVSFEYRDPRFFEFDRTAPDRLLLLADGGREELKAAGWIVHRAKAKSGLTIRGGLARQVAWPYLFQTFNLKDWAVFCEAYGQPKTVGKYDSGASDADKRALLDAIGSIATDFAAIMPKETAIEFIEAKLASSTDLYERRADWIDRQVSKIVLGQTGTTDGIEGGGYAQGKVHERVRDDIMESDAEQLAATLNEQLVIPLVLFNFPARVRKGFPEIRIGRPDEEDVTAWADNVQKLVPLGLEVGMEEAQRKLGVTPPDKGALLLRPSASPPATLPAPDARNQPPGRPGQEAPAVAAALDLADADAIDLAVEQMLAGDGWEPLVGPVIDGLAEEIAAAKSVEEVKAVLRRRAESMGTAAFTSLLARAVFGARLAGETEEDLA